MYSVPRVAGKEPYDLHDELRHVSRVGVVLYIHLFPTQHLKTAG